ncbi:glycoprotein-N-acetylgalactosamine 3-beta-galactosyltransferase 1-like isoform X2 [Symsagittifera roscoffensis]|uniref:glycoprotein-N-acetylgalactosamine 3-beta-galactosyltransferase 1-like isoform X2 n=1 Tax=Symsagittifera roscoffensis TaxID=84072 RepID=UPI00307B3837
MFVRSSSIQLVGMTVMAIAGGFILASLYSSRLSYRANSSVLNVGARDSSRGLQQKYFVDSLFANPSKDTNGAVSKNFNSSSIDQKPPADLSVVKLLCFVETCTKNVETKATAIKNTWAKRCDKTIFISDETSDSFPTLKLPGMLEGYPHLWSKTILTYQYLYENYVSEYHWFVKADDDTFLVVENLRAFLATLSPNEPHYLGKRFKALGGYTSGGAGYVISRKTLSKLGHGLKNKSLKCDDLNSKAPEDNAVGRCLKKLGIEPGKTIDTEEKELFHSFNLQTELSDKPPSWVYSYAYYPVKSGTDCCGNYTISFHYVSPKDMKMLEFMFYKLKVFGQQGEVPQVHEAYLSNDSSVKLPPETKSEGASKIGGAIVGSKVNETEASKKVESKS